MCGREADLDAHGACEDCRVLGCPCPLCADVKLERYAPDTYPEGAVAWTDGVHVFFEDHRTRRWRWARKTWEDDGVGVRSHGAAFTLEDAVADALRKDEERRP